MNSSKYPGIVKSIKRSDRRDKKLQIPPEINNISDLIKMVESGENYMNIDNEMLNNIYPQLCDINDMIGMDKLKESIFYHVIYYLLNLFTEKDNDFLHTVILGPPGSGKCLEKDTMVLLYNGDRKKVQDIQVGDLLMGDDSTPRSVLSVCSGYDHIYEISPENSDLESDKYSVNSSHILSLINNETGEIEDLELEKYISNSEKYSGFRSSIHIKNNTHLKICPYIFGYTIVNHTIVDDIISTDIFDRKVLEYLCEQKMIDEGDLSPITFELQLDDEYKEYYTKKFFPKGYERFSREVLEQILSGIVDSVCSVSNGNVSMKFKDNTINLFYGIKNICNILGIPYDCSITCYDYRVHQSDKIMNVYSLVLYDIYSFIPSIVYKSDYIHNDERRIVKYPINYRYVGMNEYYGFEIGGNGRFVLGNYIITHNTSIARIIGEMYKNMGILSVDGVFKIAKREDLVAEYLGQTAVKTKKLLKSCIGGVLFIDEVYSLGSGYKDKDSFAKEAVDTLNAFLSENNESFCCIIAGYEQDVKKCFFDMNKGLERRFQWVHRIDSYSPSELSEMFIKIIKDNRWCLSDEISRDVVEKIIHENKDLFKSYGGDIENWITKSKMAHAKRIISEKNPSKHILTHSDILQGLSLMPQNKVKEQEDNSYIHSIYM
jgi:hypothetical protein